MKPSTRRVFDALLAAPNRTLTTHALCQPDLGGVRFGGRLHELKHDHGCVIEGHRIHEGGWAYKLVSWPQDLAPTAVGTATFDPGGLGGSADPGGSHLGTPSDHPGADGAGGGGSASWLLAAASPTTRRNRVVHVQVLGLDGVYRWEEWTREEWETGYTMVDDALADPEFMRECALSTVGVV